MLEAKLKIKARGTTLVYQAATVFPASCLLGQLAGRRRPFSPPTRARACSCFRGRVRSRSWMPRSRAIALESPSRSPSSPSSLSCRRYQAPVHRRFPATACPLSNSSCSHARHILAHCLGLLALALPAGAARTPSSSPPISIAPS
jgi:hypothetical protein